MKKLFLFSFVIFACSNKKSDIEEAREALAKRDYSKAMSLLNPYAEQPSAEIQFLLGKIYLGFKNLKETKKFFKETISLDTTYKDSVVIAYANRGIELKRVGELNMALKMLKEAEKIDNLKPKPEGYVAMGDIYRVFGEATKAEYYYKKALEFIKDVKKREEIWVKLIETYEEIEDWEKASIACENAMKEKLWHFQLKYTQNAYHWANTLFKNGKLDSAKLLIENVLKLEIPNPIKGDIYLLAGEIYLVNGEFEKAASLYKEILELDAPTPPTTVEKAKQRLLMLKKER